MIWMNRIDSMLSVLSVPRHQKALRYLRIVVGCILLYIYAINFNQRYFLFGPESVYSDPALFNVFRMVNSTWFNVLYFIAIAAALCLAVGIGGRLVTAVNLIFFWSWTSASALIGDGGDNLLRVMLPYLILTDLAEKLDREPSSLWQKTLGIIHNFGLLAIIIQLCFVYLTAGLMKIQGEMWRDGTALYYVLQVNEFSNPRVAPFIIKHTWLSVMGSYATVLYQIAFPFLVFHRRLKLAVVLVSVSFHLGIWIYMNLPTFSWVMIIFEIVMFSDQELTVYSSRLRSFVFQNPAVTKLRNYRKRSDALTVSSKVENL